MTSAGSFMMEGPNLLYVVGVAMRVILVGITRGVHGFASIAASRATSELVVHFLSSVGFWTLQT